MGANLKAFIDSNVILYHLEGRINLLDIRNEFKVYSNVIVFSEIFMVYLKLITGEKSYTLKHNSKLIIEKKNDLEDLFMLFKIFEELEIKKEVSNLAFEFITRYGLLPNDALILATCKFYNLKYLISFDKDFKNACKKEGITLVDSAEKLKSFLKS